MRKPRNSAEHRRAVPNLTAQLDRSLPAVAIESLRRIGDEARRTGFRAYLVGGAVRDALMRRPVVDVDVVIEGDAIALARALAERHGGAVRAHERFVTATWQPAQGPPIDLATARTETYPSPGELPIVAPGTLAEDLIRRDFTINAMAASLDPAEFGALLDPHGGLDDLRAKKLRVLHARSFEDDPTRAFRAARFVATLGKSIDHRTRRWMRAALEAGHFERLSPARVRRELVRALGGRRPGAAAQALAHAQLLRFLHPRLTLASATTERLRRLEAALAWHERACADEPIERWTLVLACAAQRLTLEERRQLADRVGAQRSERDRIVKGPIHATRIRAKLAQLRARTPSRIHAICRDHDAESLLLALAATDRTAVRQALKRYLTDLRAITLSIKGTDLLRAGIPAGPRIAAGLSAALAAKLDGKANTPARELEAALRTASRRAAKRR